MTTWTRRVLDDHRLLFRAACAAALGAVLAVVNNLSGFTFWAFAFAATGFFVLAARAANRSINRHLAALDAAHDDPDEFNERLRPEYRDDPTDTDTTGETR